MTRTLYFIRHAHPAAQNGQRRCISQTDLPLDRLGISQSLQLAAWLKAHPVRAICTSPLLRCRQTADILSGGAVPVFIDERLTEMRVGEWENLPFDEIRTRYPALYALRGEHMGTTAPPGGESFIQAGARLSAFLRSLPDEPGDIVLVSHGGILRGWLCGVMNIPSDDVLSIRQPWGGITTVIDDDGRYTVSSVGLKPVLFPSDDEIASFYSACHTPPDVQAHCRAVAARAMALCETSSIPLDRDLLRAAALLHDICRAEGRAHPAKAAQKLDAAGYPLLASIIAQHHDLTDSPPPEAEALFLADKLIQGTAPVTLEERFSRSRQKCSDAQALAAWQKRYDQALALERKYICLHSLKPSAT